MEKLSLMFCKINKEAEISSSTLWKCQVSFVVDALHFKKEHSLTASSIINGRVRNLQFLGLVMVGMMLVWFKQQMSESVLLANKVSRQHLQQIFQFLNSKTFKLYYFGMEDFLISDQLCWQVLSFIEDLSFPSFNLFFHVFSSMFQFLLSILISVWVLQLFSHFGLYFH